MNDECICETENYVKYCYDCSIENPTCKGAKEWHIIKFVPKNYYKCEAKWCKSD
jgi:hypothetical protein